MTIGELKQEVKDYLHVGASHDATDLVIVNRLVLSALNKARKWAERENDFALAMVHGSVTVSPTTGGSLASVAVSGVGNVAMKSLVNVFLESPTGSGNLYPLTRRPRRVYVGMVQKSNQLMEARLPDDWPTEAPSTVATVNMEVHTFGGSIFLEPSPTVSVTLVLDGYRWMDDYTDDADTDFFTEHGHDFLLWHAVVSVNHKLEVFAQRQEGTLSPPTAARDEAWESLLKWDSFMHEEGREHTLGS
jgi:hypothetical protein